MPYSTVSAQRPNADINITPLVDVMLVLLIIFMVTMPVLSQRIRVDLPQTPPQPITVTPPEPIDLRIDGASQVFWNESPTPVAALQQMMQAEVQRDPANPPVLQIDSSDDAEYDVLAKVLAAARNADMQRIGFVQNAR
ncbi:biopolymer transporter ExbD [Luteimonas sp. SX5]|uniref:Biopolymer transporter ExbD n=1 Tax=Luteimonas galliterrae TaxID=2940486 RepID=A0ABT0MM92_9GAMM|nr:biopolymer transporter ExbD [Luteimonas galliterrae]MCL1636003.1 biopolymer transporter ExbD [Luteimonas galliterrae]